MYTLKFNTYENHFYMYKHPNFSTTRPARPARPTHCNTKVLLDVTSLLRLVLV